ncbi:type VII secretion protein EccB [Gordonia neofelifaecis]|uniref:Type VII secretion protein EccB n=1 Tax=Gordonia neofelifaecis NRRL B-59395 TaxID=644548 RepID=F1YER9_9ACTN|nr:type VII secretion protein EccB [Gordonia neofelifaecis]EGD56902.1 hypothetical protein SCNU_00950 [Gordonia neofelifaecis NRRL B-59395]
MSRHTTTRAQVSGYRFGVARATHALVRHDVRMTHDPMRSQSRSLLAGAVVALLVVAGAAVYGLVRPQPSVGDAQIVAADGGGLYVLLDDVMHPVPNLASARLILGQPLPVRRASDASLAGYPRGAEVGIVGAPGVLAGPADPDRSTWTVCEDAQGSAVIAGALDPTLTDPLDAELVEHAGTAWLLYSVPGPGGTSVPVRAPVDLSRPELIRSLGLADATAREVGAGLLSSLPARAELRVPEVPGRGGPGVLGMPVGTVVATVAVDGTSAYHLVLRDAVQPLSEPAAEMMRLADPDAADRVRRVAPGAVAALPEREEVPLGDFPARPPRVADRPSPALCHRWSRDADGEFATAELLAARKLPIPSGAQAVRLASADGPGPALDRVFVPPGSGAHIVLTGVEPDSPRAATPYYVSDAGVRYRLSGGGVGQMLGLPDPMRAPWPMIALLPEGLELSREAAAVMRDAVSNR